MDHLVKKLESTTNNCLLGISSTQKVKFKAGLTLISNKCSISNVSGKYEGSLEKRKNLLSV